MASREEKELQARIRELESRLEESEQLIEAIRAGEVDAFAIQNDNKPEVYTLQSGDYAYRVLIEEFGEGAINVTEEGLIVYTNAYFAELLQLPYDRVIGSPFLDFTDPESAGEFELLLEESLTGKSKGEINLSVNGKTIPVYISLTSLQPKLPTVGIIITDLTEKRSNEKLIIEYQKTLESKNVELLRSNTELASFAYIASHDLQEPLRKIQTFASRLLEKEYDRLSENGKGHFNRMQQAAKRMQELIEDLLSYSRTNMVERKFETIDLAKVVEQVKSDLKEELIQKNAAVETKGSCQLLVIPFQFRQLLHNLISNSLKFSEAGRAPRIEIDSEISNGTRVEEGMLKENAKFCHITISDNGIGFEPEYSEKIFELFQRLHGKSEFSGTGIGLAIVKKIVENHGGTITARSELGKGATFDMYIPTSAQ